MQQLLASLHPPSPPTAPEGQRLLNVLQGSFQKQLDEKHPDPFHTKSDAHDKHYVPITRESVSSHATTNYFASVLSHPVISTAVDPSTAGKDAVARFERMFTDSKLSMTSLQLLMQSYTEARKKADVESSALLGDRVNSWLHTTDHVAREQFFLTTAFPAAIQMLRREKNEAVLWKWLRMVYERDMIDADLTDRSWLVVENRLVAAIMSLAIGRGDLQDAAQQFVRACQYQIDSGRTQNPQATFVPLISKSLASAIIYYRHQHGIPAKLFTEVRRFLLPWTQKSRHIGPEFSDQLCAIYDPAQPTARLLYHGLANQQRFASSLIDRQARASATSRKTIMTAVLDASKVALDQGHHLEASFLLDFAIDHYPDYLPPRETKETAEQLEVSFNFAPG